MLSPEVQKVTHTLLPAQGDNVWVGLDDSTGAPLNINSNGALHYIEEVPQDSLDAPFTILISKWCTSAIT